MCAFAGEFDRDRARDDSPTAGGGFPPRAPRRQRHRHRLRAGLHALLPRNQIPHRRPERRLPDQQPAAPGEPDRRHRVLQDPQRRHRCRGRRLAGDQVQRCLPAY